MSEQYPDSNGSGSFDIHSSGGNGKIEKTSPPRDALLFHGGELVLRNLPQAADLRRLVQQVGVEISQAREITTYRLDARAFRQTFQAGASAARMAQQFAETGFPLPENIRWQLERWQEGLLQRQIYENVAVIEFADDLALSEIQAAVELPRGAFYAASARCLVVLRPDLVSGLLEGLRLKGYTPRLLEDVP
jgi:hypothetical protein